MFSTVAELLHCCPSMLKRQILDHAYVSFHTAFDHLCSRKLKVDPVQGTGNPILRRSVVAWFKWALISAETALHYILIESGPLRLERLSPKWGWCFENPRVASRQCKYSPVLTRGASVGFDGPRARPECGLPDRLSPSGARLRMNPRRNRL